VRADEQRTSPSPSRWVVLVQHQVSERLVCRFEVLAPVPSSVVSYPSCFIHSMYINMRAMFRESTGKLDMDDADLTTIFYQQHEWRCSRCDGDAMKTTK
jgi:hypothetical protein